ncbi:unnamed protein product [Citrullus colocynthis]|uniref:Uncharacterized protein n=1 Tax=Citrullus colocynthis TaxID=252529 RepID=A0ABP0YSX3_9ROSI
MYIFIELSVVIVNPTGHSHLLPLPLFSGSNHHPRTLSHLHLSFSHRHAATIFSALSLPRRRRSPPSSTPAVASSRGKLSISFRFLSLSLASLTPTPAPPRPIDRPLSFLTTSPTAGSLTTTLGSTANVFFFGVLTGACERCTSINFRRQYVFCVRIRVCL